MSEPVTPTLSPPVRNLPIARIPTPGDPVREFARQQPPIPALDPEGQEVPDGALQTYYGPGRAPTAGAVSFEGVKQGDPGTGGVPPDPIGDVGPNHYVQMVNVAFTIFSKTGAVLTGPTAINSLWAGLGNACATATDGDPVVVYDDLANRWFLSQFNRVTPAGPFNLCFAVSQTADPTGAYHRYQFAVPAFPDYYKVGVWPDAYYVGANETPSGVFAFDRPRMLAGLPATFQKFTPAANGIHTLMLPSDLDGAARRRAQLLLPVRRRANGTQRRRRPPGDLRVPSRFHDTGQLDLHRSDRAPDGRVLGPVQLQHPVHPATGHWPDTRLDHRVAHVALPVPELRYARDSRGQSFGGCGSHGRGSRGCSVV